MENIKQVKYKLAETVSRSLFVILMIYFLPVELSGKFGFLTLLFSLFATFYGFERYISLQRQVVNESDEFAINEFATVLKFYIINFLIAIPFLILFIKIRTFDSYFLIGCCVLISFVEHISNSVYNISIVYVKFLKAMPVIIIKNLLLLIVACYLIVFKKNDPLETVVIIWAIISLIQILFFMIIFFRLMNLYKIIFWKFDLAQLFQQYKFAYVNFLIGIVALLSLQADRLIVGISFNTAITGMYFRHVSIISILYQLFNIVSYNRLLPNVFLHAKTETFDFLKKIITREYIRAVIAISLGIVFFMFAYYFFAKRVLDYFHIDLIILVVLLTIFAIRIYADYRAMILNALHLELKTLIFQVSSLVLGILLMFSLIPFFNVKGVLASSFIGTITYALLMFQYRPKSITK